jgi:hypothetical protein
MLVINTADLSGTNTIDLNAPVFGSYELIHVSEITLTEGYINSKRNTINWTVDTTDYSATLTDADSEDVTTLVADLNAKTGTYLTWAVESGNRISVLAVNANTTLNLSTSNARVLFNIVSDTALSTTVKTYLFVSSVSYPHLFEVTIDEAISSTVTTNNSNPTLVVDITEGATSGQIVTFADPTTQLTFTFKEYNGLETFSNTEIHQLNFVLKKSSGRNMAVFVSSTDRSYNSSELDIPVYLQIPYQVEVFKCWSNKLPIIYGHVISMLQSGDSEYTQYAMPVIYEDQKNTLANWTDQFDNVSFPYNAGSTTLTTDTSLNIAFSVTQTIDADGGSLVDLIDDLDETPDQATLTIDFADLLSEDNHILDVHSDNILSDYITSRDEDSHSFLVDISDETVNSQIIKFINTTTQSLEFYSINSPNEPVTPYLNNWYFLLTPA